MKDKAWYNKLWQDKMLELPEKGDADAAWQKMQGLLDNNMPVNPPSNIRTPGKFGGSQLLTVAAVITTAALLFYAGTRLYKGHKHKINKDTVNQIKAVADSILKDTLKTENYPQDSASINKQNNSAGDSVIKDGKTNPAGKTEASDTSSKINGKSNVVNGQATGNLNSADKIAARKGADKQAVLNKAKAGVIANPVAGTYGRRSLQSSGKKQANNKGVANAKGNKQSALKKGSLDTVAGSASSKNNVFTSVNQGNNTTTGNSNTTQAGSKGNTLTSVNPANNLLPGNGSATKADDKSASAAKNDVSAKAKSDNVKSKRPKVSKAQTGKTRQVFKL